MDVSNFERYLLEATVYTNAHDAGDKSSVQARNTIGGKSFLVHIQEAIKLALASACDTLRVCRKACARATLYSVEHSAQ